MGRIARSPIRTGRDPHGCARANFLLFCFPKKKVMVVVIGKSEDVILSEHNIFPGNGEEKKHGSQ